MNYLNSANFPATASAALSGFVNMFAPRRSWLPTNWNAQPYTGNGIVANGSNQLGYNDLNGGYGSTTIQAAPGKIGLFLNGFSTETHTSPNYVHQWSMGVTNKAYAGNDRPWANGKWLHCAVQIRLDGQYFGSNACGYSYVVLVLHDTTTNKGVHILYNLSDSRTRQPIGTYSGVSVEAGNVQIAFAQSDVHTSLPQYTQSLGANARRGTADSVDSFWFLVGPQHLQNLLRKVRALPGFANLSTNSADYVLEAVSIQPELAATSGQPVNIPGQFGFTVESCNFVSQ